MHTIGYIRENGIYIFLILGHKSFHGHLNFILFSTTSDNSMNIPYASMIEFVITFLFFHSSGCTDLARKFFQSSFEFIVFIEKGLWKYQYKKNQYQSLSFRR